MQSQSESSAESLEPEERAELQRTAEEPSPEPLENSGRPVGALAGSSSSLSPVSEAAGEPREANDANKRSY